MSEYPDDDYDTKHDWRHRQPSIRQNDFFWVTFVGIILLVLVLKALIIALTMVCETIH